MAAAGVPIEVRAHLQSHGLSGVQARHYVRHDYLPEKEQALRSLFEIVGTAERRVGREKDKERTMKERYPSELRRRRTVSWSEACVLLELDDVGFAEWLRDEFAHAGSDAKLLPFLDIPLPGVPARISYSDESTGGYSLLLRTAEYWRSYGPVSSLKRPSLRGAEERSSCPGDVFPPEGQMHGVAWIKRDELSRSVLLDSTLMGRVFLTPKTVQEALRCNLELSTIFAAPLQWQGKSPAWPLSFIFEAGVLSPVRLRTQ